MSRRLGGGGQARRRVAVPDTIRVTRSVCSRPRSSFASRGRAGRADSTRRSPRRGSRRCSTSRRRRRSRRSRSAASSRAPGRSSARSRRTSEASCATASSRSSGSSRSCARRSPSRGGASRRADGAAARERRLERKRRRARTKELRKPPGRGIDSPRWTSSGSHRCFRAPAGAHTAPRQPRPHPARGRADHAGALGRARRPHEHPSRRGARGRLVLLVPAGADRCRARLHRARLRLLRGARPPRASTRARSRSRASGTAISRRR